MKRRYNKQVENENYDAPLSDREKLKIALSDAYINEHIKEIMKQLDEMPPVRPSLRHRLRMWKILRMSKRMYTPTPLYRKLELAAAAMIVVICAVCAAYINIDTVPIGSDTDTDSPITTAPITTRPSLSTTYASPSTTAPSGFWPQASELVPTTVAPDATTSPPTETTVTPETTATPGASAEAELEVSSIEELCRKIRLIKSGGLPQYAKVGAEDMDVFYAPDFDTDGYTLDHIVLNDTFLGFYYRAEGESEFNARTGITVQVYRGTVPYDDALIPIEQSYGITRNEHGHLYIEERNTVFFLVDGMRVNVCVPDSLNDYKTLKDMCKMKRITVD